MTAPPKSFVIGGGVFGLNTIINVKKLFCLSHVLFAVGSACNAVSRNLLFAKSLQDYEG